MEETKGHLFELHSFLTPVGCDICEKFIWHFKEDGYKCSRCNIIAHKKCRSGSLQCGNAKRRSRRHAAMTGGEILLEHHRVEEAKNGGTYQIEVIGSVPVCHWFYRENDQWWPYDDVLSEKIEEAFKKRNNEHKVTFEDVTFNFNKLKSKKKWS